MKDFGLFHITKSIPYIPEAAKKLPPVWGQNQTKRIRVPVFGEAFYNKPKNLLVICSLDTMGNGNIYLHVSLSHPNKIPEWSTIKMVKHLFIGDNRNAFIWLPVKEEYVNFMPYCLHLWSEEA